MPPKRGMRKQGASGTTRENPRAIGTSRPSVNVSIEDLSAFDESVNILIHGHSGVGKTVLAAGAPNAVFLSTEKGVIAAKRQGIEAGLIRAPDWEHVMAGLNLADKELGPDDWLIVDSATKMQVLYIRWILRMVREENDWRDEDIPAIQDHQKWQNGFMRFADHIVDARYNSIIITTSMIRDDPDGESIVLPAITGKDYTISNYVSAQCDAVYYYGIAPAVSKTEPTVRRLLTEAYPPYFAKDRFSCFERWIDIEDGVLDTMAWIIETIGAKNGQSKI